MRDRNRRSPRWGSNVIPISPKPLTNSPQYIEIYRLRQVIGISLFFMAVDMAGGVFSVISLAFRDDLDILGVVSIAIHSVSS